MTTHDERPAWAAKIHEIRMERGMTQEQLARATGVSRDSVARYCSGLTRPPLDKLLLISRALGVKPSAIDPEAAHLDSEA